MKIRVDRGAHGIPTRIEFIFTKISAQLTSNFSRWIIPWRQRPFETVVITILNRAQRLRQRQVIGGTGQIPVFIHFLKNKIPTRGSPLFLAHGMIGGRRLWQCSQIGRFFRHKFAQRLIKICLRRSRHAKGVLPQENFIQVQFQNIFFAQRVFDTRGKDNLFDFAFCRSRPIQQKVLHHLLCDCGRPTNVLSARHNRVAQRRCHTHRVIARVVIEIFVFCRNKGGFHKVRYFFLTCE